LGQSFLNPYVQTIFFTPLWTAGFFVLLRYRGWTYALVPAAGIVAMIAFAQGRYSLN
jgi:hypothetical protein